jgi:hypothetical protein
MKGVCPTVASLLSRNNLWALQRRIRRSQERVYLHIVLLKQFYSQENNGFDHIYENVFNK